MTTSVPASPFTTPAPEPNRDRWGRPLVVPPGGGKPKAYTRATTLAGTLDDLYGLMGWKQRQTALGLADRPDLMLAVAANRDDKRRLDDICEQALEASKSSAAATIGSALHTFTEMLDRGQDLPTLPAETAADIEAYRQATAGLEPLLIEQFTVCDDIEVAGTPDRIVRDQQGRIRIADLKSGNVTYAAQKIAIQLAIYAHSLVYDVATGQRSALPDGLDLDTALVIHLPAGTGQCELLEIDIAAGWEAVQHAVWTRAWRKRRNLTRPVGEFDGLHAAIAGATSVDELTALYLAHTATWTDEHTAAAAGRKQQLLGAA